MADFPWYKHWPEGVPKSLDYPDIPVQGLLTATDCLMTHEEAQAMARAIPTSRLVVVPGTNHYTVLMGRNPKVRAAVRRFLRGR